VNIALWGAALGLAFIVLAAGFEKLATPYADLRRKRPWVSDADPRMVRLIGLLEVLGAIGLVVPAIVGIATGLVPLAAACLAVLLVGAIVVEARHHRPGSALVLPVASLIVAVFVAVGRAGPWSF
jgi:DoxX-like family